MLKAFSHSNLLTAKLREIKSTIELATGGLCSLSKTRFASAVFCIERLIENKEALKLLARDEHLDRSSATIVEDKIFWIKLQDVLDVSLPIKTAITLSEKSKLRPSEAFILFLKMCCKILQDLHTTKTYLKTYEYRISRILYDRCVKYFSDDVYLLYVFLDPNYDTDFNLETIGRLWIRFEMYMRSMDANDSIVLKVKSDWDKYVNGMPKTQMDSFVFSWFKTPQGLMQMIQGSARDQAAENTSVDMEIKMLFT